MIESIATVLTDRQDPLNTMQLEYIHKVHKRHERPLKSCVYLDITKSHTQM